MTAWQLIARERRGAVLLELADAVRASLVTLLDEPELIGARPADGSRGLRRPRPGPAAGARRCRARAARLRGARRGPVGAVVPRRQRRRAHAARRRHRARRRHARGRDRVAAPARQPAGAAHVVDGRRPQQRAARHAADRSAARSRRRARGQRGHGRRAEVFPDERPRRPGRRGVRALRPDRRAGRESAQAGRRHADRRQGARAGQAGLVQASVEPGRLERGRGSVRADLAERPQAPRVARAQSVDGVRRVARRRRLRRLDRAAHGARGVDADRREHRRQHGQSDRGARDPRFGVVAVERAQHVLLAAQGARDRRRSTARCGAS